MSILKFSKDLKKDVSRFWDREEGKVFSYYLEQRREDDVICSASPTFLIKEIMSRINKSATCICSEIDDKTFKFKNGEQNNKGQVKVDKLHSMGFTHFLKGYSDSTSDIPMLSLCQEKFRVKNGHVSPFDKKYFLKK